MLEPFSSISKSNIFCSHVFSKPMISPLWPLLSAFLNSLDGPGLISLEYSLFSSSTATALPSCKWDTDLENYNPGEDWATMESYVAKSSSNVLVEEADYKVHLLWYFVPLSFSQVIPTQSPQCFCNCWVDGSSRHIWWDCPKVHRFWITVYQMMNTVMSKSFRRNLMMLSCLGSPKNAWTLNWG